jgi:hypothetical protein
MESPPLSFRALAQNAGNPASGGYPYAIRGDDLDKNFVAATAIYNEEDFEVTKSAGLGGHDQPKVKLKNKLPDPPANGFQLLGGANNAYSFLTGQKPGALISWVEGIVSGEEGGWSIFSPNKNGQIPVFKKQEESPATEQWSFLTPQKEGQLFYWHETEGKWKTIDPATDGQMIYWHKTEGKWKTIDPATDGQMIYWHAEEKKWKLLSPGTDGSFPQWNQTDKWSVKGGSNTKDALLKFNLEAKEWQPFNPPATGTHVLGAVNGTLTWLDTEEC